MDINSISLTGRLTAKPELRKVNDKSVTDISIAVNRNKDQVSYFDITVWSKQAENICQYLDKGSRIALEGELVQDRWEKDGTKHYKVKILAYKVIFLDSKKQEISNDSTTDAAKDKVDANDDDIPF